MKTRANWILACTAFAFSIALAEIGLRLNSEPLGFTRGASGDIAGLWLADDTLGYRYSPGFSGEHVTRDFRVPVVIDSAGFRSSSQRTPGQSSFSILVAGNSLAFGWGVRPEDSWPIVLQSTLRGERNATVFNAGVSGYNVDQMARRAERETSRYPYDLTIVEVYAGGVDRLNRPFALIGDRFVMRADVRPKARVYRDGIILAPFENASAITLNHWFAEHFRIGQFALHAAGRIWGVIRRRTPKVQTAQPPLDDAMSAALHQRIVSRLEELQYRLGKSGSRLLVLIAVTQEPTGEVSYAQRTAALQLGRTLAAADIDFMTTLPLVDSASAFGKRLRFQNDAHWNATAHAVIGRRLACYVETSECSQLGN